jgi:glyoxylase-like metal-dependent hydrolase (beta-lactamase superfamily II)
MKTYIILLLAILTGPFQLAAQNSETKIRFSLIETSSIYASEALVFKGGRLKKRRIVHGAVYIEHPKGNLLFDAGLGENIDKTYSEEMPRFSRLFFKYKMKRSAWATLKDSQKEGTVKYIIPSHLHWDHSGGIKDFPAAIVMVPEDEKHEADTDKNKLGTYFRSDFNGDVKWKFIQFKDSAYEFSEKSLDVFGDGSLILVPLPGHTCGSTGLFINLPSGKRYFFTGDLTWAAEAFDRKAPKHFFPRKIVDKNPVLVLDQIKKIADWKKDHPEVILVPAHDADVWINIGLWPAMIE